MHQIHIVGACTIITSSKCEQRVALFHQLMHDKSPNQNESLALHFQLIENSVPKDLAPKCYNSVEVESDTQSFSIEGESYLLEFYGRKMHVEMSKPTQDDYDNLPTFEMNSSYPFNPELDNLPKPSHLSNKKLRFDHRKFNNFSESSGAPAGE